MIAISVFASPINNRAGAGGPMPKPIPSTCDITNPLPLSNCSITTTTSGYKPASTFASNYTLYGSYFDFQRLPTNSGSNAVSSATAMVMPGNARM